MKSFILLASFLATSIAMACPSDKLCNGDRIIDSSNNIGEVIEVFSNGKAKVLFDGSFRNTNNLGKGYRCIESVCSGDRIIDSSNNIGEVIEVFSNGKAKVLFDGSFSYSFRNTNNLGKGYRCIESVCSGDRIMDTSNNVGKIVEVFDNGKTKVLFDGSFSYSFRLFSSLGIELNCRLRENCSCRN